METPKKLNKINILKNTLFKSMNGRLFFNNLILIVIVFVFILLSIWMADTLYLTTSIARMERTHSIQLTDAKASFYKYLTTKNENDIINCFNHLDTANSYSENFGNIVNITRMANGKDTILKIYNEADSKIADIMISRISILYWLPQIVNLISIAADTSELTGKYRILLKQIIQERNDEAQKTLKSQLLVLDDKIENNENPSVFFR